MKRFPFSEACINLKGWNASAFFLYKTKQTPNHEGSGFVMASHMVWSLRSKSDEIREESEGQVIKRNKLSFYELLE